MEREQRILNSLDSKLNDLYVPSSPPLLSRLQFTHSRPSFGSASESDLLLKPNGSPYTEQVTGEHIAEATLVEGLGLQGLVCGIDQLSRVAFKIAQTEVVRC